MQGGAMGFLDGVSSLCRVVAPLLAGVLIDRYGTSVVFGLEAALCVLGVVALLADIRKGGQQPPQLKSE